MHTSIAGMYHSATLRCPVIRHLWQAQHMCAWCLTDKWDKTLIRKLLDVHCRHVWCAAAAILHQNILIMVKNVCDSHFLPDVRTSLILMHCQETMASIHSNVAIHLHYSML